MVDRGASPRRDGRRGDGCRRSATAVAVPQQLSRYGEAPSCAMQAIAAHLSPFRDRRDRDFVAKVVPPLGMRVGGRWEGVYGGQGGGRSWVLR